MGYNKYQILLSIFILHVGYVQADVQDLTATYNKLYTSLQNISQALDAFIQKPDLPPRPSVPAPTPGPTPPPLPPRDEHFTKSIAAFDTLFPQGVVHTPFERAKHLASLRSDLMKQNYLTIKDFVNDYQQFVDAFSQQTEQAKVQTQRLLRLYKILLHDFKDRFDKNYLYKGGILYDPTTHLNTTILLSSRIELIKSILQHIAQIQNRIKENPLLEPMYGQPLKVLQNIYTDIKNHADDYFIWEGLYPVLSSTLSPLEKNMMDTLKKELNTIWQKDFRKERLTNAEKTQFKNKLIRLMSLAYRVYETVDSIRREVQSFDPLYERITNEPLNWATHFKKFKEDIEKKRKEKLETLRRSREESDARMKVFKEYIRYVKFSDINAFKQVLDKYLPQKKMEPQEPEQDIEKNRERYNQLDDEISAWLKKNKDSLDRVAKSEIQKMITTIKEYNSLADILGEPREFTSELILLQQSLRF